ncbi:MAG: pilus assembly protein N-terminal domain-containing protein [Pseudomonadota bacterium]
MKKIAPLFLIALFLMPVTANAQQVPSAVPEDSIFDVSVPQPQNTRDATNLSETHPMIRLTPEKSELIRLDKDAVSVVVGNPAHLSVLLDTPRVLVLIPRVPGATHFSVLDRNGNLIMQRHAIVASPKQNYVRVRRSCINAGESAGCNATSVYFCPDMCHEINVAQMESEEEAGVPETPTEAPAGPVPTDTPEQ